MGSINQDFAVFVYESSIVGAFQSSQESVPQVEIQLSVQPLLGIAVSSKGSIAYPLTPPPYLQGSSNIFRIQLICRIFNYT